MIVGKLRTHGFSFGFSGFTSWGRMSEGEDVRGTLWGRKSEGGNLRDGKEGRLNDQRNKVSKEPITF